MVKESDQTAFNLRIIRESLESLTASSNEQLLLNKSGLTHLDDIFDPMSLDYLPWLIEKEVVDPIFDLEFRELFKRITLVTKHFEWHEEGEFIVSNDTERQEWRAIAGNLLDTLNGLQQRQSPE